MIPREPTEKVITNFTGEDHKFTLSNNRAIFNILRKGIYTNPIESCVRELLNNSRDAQRRNVNSDEPINITINNNYLVIADKGTGMSKEKIKDVK